MNNILMCKFESFTLATFIQFHLQFHPPQYSLHCLTEMADSHSQTTCTCQCTLVYLLGTHILAVHIFLDSYRLKDPKQLQVLAVHPSSVLQVSHFHLLFQSSNLCPQGLAHVGPVPDIFSILQPDN